MALRIAPFIHGGSVFRTVIILLLDLLRQKCQYSLLKPYIYVICLPLLTTHICKRGEGVIKHTTFVWQHEMELLVIGPFN